jgi:hypothetical protein
MAISNHPNLNLMPSSNPSPPSLNPPLKQPNQLIQPLNNNMRPRIHFQLLFALAADQNRQSARFVARDHVVDAVTNHDQGKRGWRRARFACWTRYAPLFGDMQDSGWGRFRRLEVSRDDRRESRDVRGEVG